MHKLSLHGLLNAGPLLRLLTACGLAGVVTLEYPTATASAQTGGGAADPANRPRFREPVTLSSKDGVLEVRLTARQGKATLDTVATLVQNFLVFDYELIRGGAS